VFICTWSETAIVMWNEVLSKEISVSSPIHSPYL